MAFQRGVHKASGKSAKGGASTKSASSSSSSSSSSAKGSKTSHKSHSPKEPKELPKESPKESKDKKPSAISSLKKAIFGGAKAAASAAGKKAASATASASHDTSTAKKAGKSAAPVAAPAPAASLDKKKAGRAATPGGGGKKGTGLPRTSLLSSSFSGRHAASDADSCREVACEGLATTAGYCRLHYIKNWKKVKRKELILKEGKLNQYIEELVAKYPDKYIDAIRQDLAVEKDFAKVIYDLDLDEGVDEFDADAESGEGLIDNIKREFEDEGESGF